MLKVNTKDLQIGMYISELDRPWLETSFLIQGFHVQDREDIDIISNICEYVFVDTAISTKTITSKMSTVSSAMEIGSGTSETIVTNRDTARTRTANMAQESNEGFDVRKEMFPSKKLERYDDSTNWQGERVAAEQAVAGLFSGLDELLSQTKKGDSLDLPRIQQAVEPMIDSVIRNPDACVWLARMKQRDNYIYEHSLATSIWAVALGRQFGLPRKDLRSLAIGGLLLDIGKLQLDIEILQAPRRLTSKETRLMKKHVEIGIKLLEKDGMTNPEVLDMVNYHHERHNGTGYPHDLVGNEIPVFGRIAGIVDCYDAITSDRIYASAISPSLAIKQLYNWKDIYFQAEIVEEFIRAIGVYPAGTLVELTSGEVAIVVAASRSRRLRPEIMLLLDKERKPLADMQFIDLKEVTETEDGAPLDIVDSLEPNAYGIDLSAIVL